MISKRTKCCVYLSELKLIVEIMTKLYTLLLTNNIVLLAKHYLSWTFLIFNMLVHIAINQNVPLV